ncbi:MAG: metal/formaldehyde-sensitive transcriptional repressor [Chlorobium sp.]|jgi:DNA-binding FrmR family transcriptional regulator|uniref:metal/formaldehyde-sensitive transcriptional repressor n=1 Tax=Chlorobium sp. TaxID=1095 RepID=UPI0025B7EC0D|nr:metal/formaldehyde-sensitive transcriptional repressor [Chlorobium sp.]MCF8215300.1 metal/formaldehyde-sensitive transcriptional repressor [Chlorobium sp.]MCF8270137.1 metal/formaldehyde-sensitive transcriptional repressor [Chlorobium sp.]MCF8286507.1 metal/formaldehyde-sensitive transcriptional repressor [Chlorobium sp.]MCF8290105.1 metal/formaldehyde-sensitive transcriptional repressor [Chlorobium sp.]MCF8384177.1 metal/formaldehyde-sensitive transcriptional repressor [Chlorobium sp.]
MAHTKEGRKKLLNRISRIKGQIEALEAALERETSDCSSVLQQIASIRGAVGGLMMTVLEGHIREHIGSETISPGQRNADTEQVISVLRSYVK